MDLAENVQPHNRVDVNASGRKKLKSRLAHAILALSKQRPFGQRGGGGWSARRKARLVSSVANLTGQCAYRESRGDDLPEVGGLELVGLGEGSDGGLQEVTLGSSGTLGLSCGLAFLRVTAPSRRRTVAILDTSHLEHSLGSGGGDDTSSSGWMVSSVSWDSSLR